MRPYLAVMFLVLLSAQPALAVVDPDPDGIGVYFDLTADLTEIEVTPAVPFFAYVILTNPTGADIMAYEFSRTYGPPAGTTGLVMLLSQSWLGQNPLNPVEPNVGNNIMIGWASPFPTAATVTLMTWEMMVLYPMEVEFHLGPTDGEMGSNGQLTYLTSAGWVPMHVSTGDPTLPVATVNGSGVVPVRTTAFGSVKAIFR